MLRDKNLVPLSRQHHHALVLCVRIERAVEAGELDAAAFQSEIHQSFQQEIVFHFAAEEQLIFPAARAYEELRPLVEELIAEHASLRSLFARAQAGTLDAREVGDFAQSLACHIRKEERQLFEPMQRLMTADQLQALGSALDEALRSATEVCLLPNPATRLRPRH